MKRNQWMGLLGATVLISLGGIANSGPQASSEPVILIEATPTMVSFVLGPTAKAESTLHVRIADPAGQIVLDETSASGIVEWMPTTSLADGIYNYDIWYSPSGATVSGDVFIVGQEASGHAKEGDATAMLYRSGTLTVEFGQIGDYSPTGSIERDHDLSSNARTLQLTALERLAGVVLDLMVPAAHAAPGTFDDSVTINGDNPFILFNDDTGGTQNIWWLRNQNAHFELMDFDCLISCSGGENTLPLRIQNEAPDNALFIGPTGFVGLGTSTPTVNLQITAGSPRMIMENTGSATKWMLFGASTGLGTYYNASGSPPFWIFNNAPGAALSISGGSGNIGMGTFFPDAPLHVQRSNGTANVLVEDTGSASPLPMFTLKNNGSIRFTMANTTGHNWAFSTGSAGFSISRAGTAEEMLVRNNGDVIIRGDVTANGVLLTSSREAKTGFAPVDEHTVLEKVAALDVSQWRYKTESTTEQHIGPMAEDFQKVFGLGDGKHISAGDANGILFAAAKALKAENDSLKAEVHDLRALRTEVAELRASMEALQESR